MIFANIRISGTFIDVIITRFSCPAYIAYAALNWVTPECSLAATFTHFRTVKTPIWHFTFWNENTLNNYIGIYIIQHRMQEHCTAVSISYLLLFYRENCTKSVGNLIQIMYVMRNNYLSLSNNIRSHYYYLRKLFCLQVCSRQSKSKWTLHLCYCIDVGTHFVYIHRCLIEKKSTL